MKILYLFYSTSTGAMINAFVLNRVYTPEQFTKFQFSKVNLIELKD